MVRSCGLAGLAVGVVEGQEGMMEVVEGYHTGHDAWSGSKAVGGSGLQWALSSLSMSRPLAHDCHVPYVLAIVVDPCHKLDGRKQRAPSVWQSLRRHSLTYTGTSRVGSGQAKAQWPLMPQL